MRDATLEFESTLTDRYQTTAPTAVRQALRLGKRDRIRYRSGCQRFRLSSRGACCSWWPIHRSIWMRRWIQPVTL